MIVFVYDTERCQHEEDDPADAVLYFHPTWVSDTQKYSLCGQLMGTAHFLRETFGRAKVIALQNGKFVLKEFGRFVLVSGEFMAVCLIRNCYFRCSIEIEVDEKKKNVNTNDAMEFFYCLNYHWAAT